MKVTIKDEDYALSGSYSRITSVRSAGKTAYKTGSIIHKLGIIKIYQQGYPRGGKTIDSKFLRLTVIYNGRSYYRAINGKVYTDIGIARKAIEFLKEVVS